VALQLPVDRVRGGASSHARLVGAGSAWHHEGMMMTSGSSVRTGTVKSLVLFYCESDSDCSLAGPSLRVCRAELFWYVRGSPNDEVLQCRLCDVFVWL
jgi:hypothetical protein